MLPIIFTDGVSLGPDRCAVIAELAKDELDEKTQDFAANSVVLYIFQSKVKRVVNLDCTATRITVSNGSEEEVFVSSFGFIEKITSEGYVHELIEGPNRYGYLCGLRAIGSSIYVAGMRRQVYRRINSGKWVSIHEMVISKPENYLDVRGFEAIDGISEDEIYAVGYKGEIWRYHKEEWQKIDSPTNLRIECIRVTSSGIVYACGQKGMLLRGHDDTWVVIRQEETEDDFWGLEWFRNRLYVATNKELFILNNHDELTPINSKLPGRRTYSQLHAGQGVLWSIGAKHLAWTEDGEIWHDVVLG